jgi:hypothetical protein
LERVADGRDDLHNVASNFAYKQIYVDSVLFFIFFILSYVSVYIEAAYQ